MTKTISIPNGFITFVTTDVTCPSCKKVHGESFYYHQLKRAKRCYIYKKCDNCGEKLGISTNYMGDSVCWLKNEEQIILR